MADLDSQRQDLAEIYRRIANFGITKRLRREGKTEQEIQSALYPPMTSAAPKRAEKPPVVLSDMQVKHYKTCRDIYEEVSTGKYDRTLKSGLQVINWDEAETDLRLSSNTLRKMYQEWNSLNDEIRSAFYNAIGE